MTDLYDQEKDQGPFGSLTEAERKHFKRLEEARTDELPEPKYLDVEITEEPPKDSHRFLAAVKAEWAFYFPKGPPKTYTNGTPMNPLDSSRYGSLSAVGWLFGILVVAFIVVLVIMAINGT